MDHAARVVFVQAQTVCAMAELEAMKAANAEAARCNQLPTYSPSDFRQVPDNFQIGWNSVIEYLREG